MPENKKPGKSKKSPVTGSLSSLDNLEKISLRKTIDDLRSELSTEKIKLDTAERRLSRLQAYLNKLTDGEVFSSLECAVDMGRYDPAKISPDSDEFKRLVDYASRASEYYKLGEEQILTNYIYEKALRERIRARLGRESGNSNNTGMILGAAYLLGIDYFKDIPQPKINWFANTA